MRRLACGTNIDDSAKSLGAPFWLPRCGPKSLVFSTHHMTLRFALLKTHRLAIGS